MKSVEEEMLSLEREERWINGRKIVHACEDNTIFRRMSVLREREESLIVEMVHSMRQGRKNRLDSK
jgi:hypothetical protein